MISKLSFIILFLFFITCLINAQQKDSIIVDYSFWGNDFYVGGKEYSRGEVRDILRNNSITEELIRTSHTNNRWGSIIILAGIYFTGHAIYDIWDSDYSYGVLPYQRKDENFIVYPMIAIICDLTGIILVSKSMDSFYQAINLYNSNLPPKNQAYGYELDLKCDINRVTLTLKF